MSICSGRLLEIFFFNDTATTEIYTLSLHDALPISSGFLSRSNGIPERPYAFFLTPPCPKARLVRALAYPGRWLRRGCSDAPSDRKSTRLNSSHANISYAVFCLKKKTNNPHTQPLLQ